MNNIVTWSISVSKQAKKAQSEKGLLYTLKAVFREGYQLILNPIEYCYYKKLRTVSHFSLQGKEYQYFYHLFNLTWKNERCVEIPIILDFVRQYKEKNVLEIGNVLSYYIPINHDVLDKYEVGPRIINVDVIDFKPNKKYDLIVSISTIEHVGWDEAEKDETKILKALDNLKTLLVPGGKLVITTSLGYNPNLDNLLKTGELKLSEQYYLKRISKDNKWLEVGWEDIRNTLYGEPYPSGNSIIILIFNK